MPDTSEPGPLVTGTVIEPEALPTNRLRRVYDKGPHLAQVFHKRVEDRLDWLIDMAEYMEPGETILACQAFVSPGTMDIHCLWFTETAISVWLAGGANGEKQTVNVTAFTSRQAIKLIQFAVVTSGGDFIPSGDPAEPQCFPGALSFVPGPRGPRGYRGEKGDPGNYLGLDLIGSSADIGDRPSSASEGDAWGLLSDSGIRIYVWTDGAWYDAGPITAPSAFPVDATIFVQGFGDDSNSGSSWGNAVLTIEQAVELATEAGAPRLIEVGPGTYETRGHIDLPDNCVIRCAHRTVTIVPEPGYEQRNVFRVGSGCFIEGFLFEGFRVNSLTNPTEGFAVSFRPGAVIVRVPYTHKIAVRTPVTWGLVAPPLDRAAGNPLVGNGGGVVLADGSVCSPYSVFPNIMTWGATPVSPNGIGYCAKAGGLINAVNAVSMWAHRHFYALTGGQIILSGCSTQFGDFSLVASGYREIVVPGKAATTLTVQTTAATAIGSSTSTIINTMWSALVTDGYTAGWTSADETYTRADAASFLRCLRWVLETGNEKPMLDFARGLFNTLGARVFDDAKLPAFVFSFNKMRDDINSILGVSPATTIVTALVAALNATLSSPVKLREPSRITAIGHTWTAVMAGVALTKLPPAVNAARIQDSILEVSDGVVVASGQDDQGNALFVGGLEISADTGELSGPPFAQAVNRIATRTAIARSF